ncbi:MAG: response regulator transcription factor [Candidatus Eiseniibacteriota bacterium]
MSIVQSTESRPATLPRVLVVDDDRRVLELLEVAYTSHGFRVITAADGHEAMQKALTDRPDLLVMDVRLPRKSGLEVCELLRRDPEENHLPIILVSAAGETDARLRGFTAGADDYLPKPFSPKELIARSRRLLWRASEARDMRRRMRDLERDLARAQDEVKRSAIETRREQRLRELAVALEREFHRTLDLDELARRILLEAQARLGVGLAGLLLRDDSVQTFVPYAVRGDGLDRLAQLEFESSGALARMLPALGRPAAVRELERLPELADELPALVAARVARVAPLSGVAGLEALLVTDERLDGQEPAKADQEMMAVLCEAAGTALHTARLVRAQIDLEIELSSPLEPEDAAQRQEAAAIMDRAARATLLPPRLRGLLALAIRLGESAQSPATLAALKRLAMLDLTGRVKEFMQLINTDEPKAGSGEPPEGARAAMLFGMAIELVRARAAGSSVESALQHAARAAGSNLDPATLQALEAAVRECAWLSDSPPKSG